MKPSLNDAQRLRLRVSCRYIDQLLSEIEGIMHAANSRSPFSKYVADLSPAQVRIVEDYIVRLRAQLLRSLAWQQIESESPSIAASHAVLTHLSFIDIAVEELRPRYMRGSGPIAEDDAGELNGVVHELRSLVEGMTHFLRQQERSSLEGQLARLRQAGTDISLLDAIAGVLERRGLVEFRERLEGITARLADERFEIAFFGRVSTGKSSLLNALVGADVLPVGINPITAVPTRLQAGNVGRVLLRFGDGRQQEVPLAQLEAFVTEEQNPGNTRNVVQARAEIPSPRLREGIVLVDTPGLGSLARRGARETLAYLPSADLGVLLIDAAATLQDEDIATLRLLQVAGIPSIILLSKADLLSGQDIERAQSYIHDQLREHLGASPAIYPVSVKIGHQQWLDHFYQELLLPAFARAAVLRKESIERKTIALAEAVAGALETISKRNDSGPSPNAPSLADLENDLRRSVGKIGEQPRSFERNLLQLEEGTDGVLDTVCLRALLFTQSDGAAAISPQQIAEWIQEQVEAELEAPLAEYRQVAEAATQAVARIAAGLGSADQPAVSEVTSLFRNLPRFTAHEGLPIPATSLWDVFGKTAKLARIRAHLREHWRSGLQQELRAYGRLLHDWSQQTAQQSQRLMNSYADGYRVQIQRMTGAADAFEDPGEISRDLALLRPERGTPAGGFTLPPYAHGPQELR